MLPYNSYKPTEREREYVGNLLNIEPNNISYMFFNNNNINNINKQLIENIISMTFERYGKKRRGRYHQPLRIIEQKQHSWRLQICTI